MAANQFIVHGEGEVSVGERCNISPTAEVVFARPGHVEIGDYCTIGPGVKFVVDGGNVSVGDWTSLHDRCLILSTEGVEIGQHGWFGQGAVLDGSGGLRIGNGVRVGMLSQLWSHVAAGELIEGCTLFGMRPLVLEDDVWLVGSCICASGITIGRRTVALIASNITKSFGPNLVLAGSPAKIKEGLSFYSDISLDEKFARLRPWLDEAAANFGYTVEQAVSDEALLVHAPDGSSVAFYMTGSAYAQAPQSNPAKTLCCVETKRYRKRLTEVEHRVLKYLSGNKARFLSQT